MSKKDYIEFAKMFRDCLNDDAKDKGTTIAIMTMVMDILHDDNPNFDYQQFLSFVNKES